MEVQLIAIAKIIKPFGVYGACVVKVFGKTLGTLHYPRKVYLGFSTEECRETTIKTIQKNAKGYICYFQDCDNRNSAEVMRNMHIFVPQEELPKTKPGEYYYFQLLGMEVYLESTENFLGTISYVCSLPTIDAVEVVRAEGSSIFIPLSADVIKNVDTNRRRIVVAQHVIEELL